MRAALAALPIAAGLVVAAPAPAAQAVTCTSDHESASKTLTWDEGTRWVVALQTVWQYDCSDGDRFTEYVLDWRTNSCKGIQRLKADMYGIAKVNRGLTTLTCKARPGYDGAKFTQNLFNCFYVQGAGDRTGGGWVKAEVANHSDPSGRIREFVAA